MFWESQATLSYYQWIIRAVVIFIWLFIMTRLMGQRHIGRLTLFDFVIAITIGSVAASPLSRSRTAIISSILAIGTLAFLDIIIAYLALKNSKFRRIMQGEPIVLVQNGQVLEDTLRKTRVNLDDLLMGIRRQKIPNLADVEFAVLETNGKISVIPKSQSRPVSPQDLNLETKYEGFPTVLIEDGNVLQDNLAENSLDVRWLKSQLNNQGINSFNEIQIAILDTKGKLYISKKNQKNEQTLH